MIKEIGTLIMWEASPITIPIPITVINHQS